MEIYILKKEKKKKKYEQKKDEWRNYKRSKEKKINNKT